MNQATKIYLRFFWLVVLIPATPPTGPTPPHTHNTMQHDEIIWQLINHQFCSFKATISKDKNVQKFCKNEYNVSGMCNKSSCPLANSRYATIREEKGRCFLYIKTIERAHSPKNLWEKIKLPRNYAKALGIVHENLQKVQCGREG